ncbi:N-methyl-L-tryptophan oxidase [Alicyclobacillus fructus]|uniref:N-methyl-L-tryptophan oxidase n=1 Tax=Alicyclobacillus fructus TaxID=2816082 RepID=UPI001A8C41B4|nr:N-methyl-L-tryptophan oxidase [Alicyclobacillus fructus]
MQSYDTLILGAGTVGLSIAIALARRGRRVVAFDPHRPPHPFGSHHGETRMLRVLYSEGVAYTTLALVARETWMALESEAKAQGVLPEGRVLFHPVGVVGIMSADAPEARRLEQARREYNLSGGPCESLESRRRFPHIAVSTGEIAYWDPFGGILESDLCMETMRNMAEKLGVHFVFGGPLADISVKARAARVTWDTQTYEGEMLVLAAGAHAGAVLRRYFPEWQAPVVPVRKAVAWFPSVRPVSPDLPAFYCYDGDHAFYGFPDMGTGYKVGQHDGGEPCDPGALDRQFRDRDATPLEAWVRRRLPLASPRADRGQVCMYAMTPDDHFICDRHPCWPHVYAAVGLCGHGFKFAPALGEWIAEEIADGRERQELRLFRTRRFA